MKNKIIYILAGILVVSIATNVILLVNVIKKGNNIVEGNSTPNYYGVYQTTYYNAYNKQVIFTIQLNEDGSCEYGEFAASYSGDLHKCQYEIIDKNLSLVIGDSIKTGKLLDGGSLFFNNKQLYKVY